MRIAEVHAGLKTPHRITLSGRDILSGPNGAGKSAVLQTIQFVVTGRVAGIGVRDLGQLGNENRVTGTLVMDDGTRITRTLDHGKTTLEFSPGHGERTLAEKESRLAHLFGHPYILDLAAWTSLPGPEQRRQLLALVGGGADHQEIADTLSPNAWDALSHLWSDTDDPEEWVALARVYARQMRLAAERGLEEARTTLRNTQAAQAPTEEAVAAVRRQIEDLGAEIGVRRERIRQREALADAHRHSGSRPTPLGPQYDDMRVQWLNAILTQYREDLSKVPVSPTKAPGWDGLAKSACCPVDTSVVCPIDKRVWLQKIWDQATTSAEAESAAAGIRARIESTQAELRMIQSARHDYNRNLWQWEQDQNTLARLEASVLSGTEEEDRTALSQATDERAALQTKLTRVQTDIALADAYQRVSDRCTEQAAAVELWRAIEGEVAEGSPLATKMVERGIAPLLKTATNVVQAVFGNDSLHVLWDGQLGLGQRRKWEEAPDADPAEDTFIAWTGLSTGERAVVALAMQWALVVSTVPPCGVLLVDNAETMDTYRYRSALAAMTTFPGNVLVATSRSRTAPESWEITALGSAVEE